MIWFARFAFRMLIIVAITMALSSCGFKMHSGGLHENGTTVHHATRHVADSIDLAGTYSGLLLNGAQEENLATLQLSKDGTYVLSFHHLTVDAAAFFEHSGKYVWSFDALKIQLIGLDGVCSVYYFADSVLIPVLSDDSRTNGAATGKYFLRKEPFLPVMANVFDVRWVLTELMGEPVEESENTRDQIFIVLNSIEKRASGSSGCNRFFGNYELTSDNRIRFSKMGTTMMACTEQALAAEQLFLEMLSTADQYLLKGNEFVLSNGQTVPLARFVKE